MDSIFVFRSASVHAPGSNIKPAVTSQDILPPSCNASPSYAEFSAKILEYAGAERERQIAVFGFALTRLSKKVPDVF